MNLLRNFFSIPIAATLGIYTPGIYMWITLKIETFFCKLNSFFPFFYDCAIDGGYIFFFIPEIYFWLYMQTMFSGALAGITIIFIALKIAKDENNLIYISLFATSLLITVLAIYGNMQKELTVAIATIISNLITFAIAGLYPLYMVITNRKLSDDL